MRVLHVVSVAERTGGIENYLDVTFRAIQRMNLPNLDLELCYSEASSRISQQEAEDRGFKLWGLRLSYNPLNYKRYIRDFADELQRRGPYDVVHAHLSNFCALPLLGARRAGVPVRIAHYHNLQSGHKNDWPRRMVEKWLQHQLLSAATDIYSLTFAGLKVWFGERALTDPRMKVMRYGINVGDYENVDARAEIRREFGVPETAPLFGHVGRFQWQKNHTRLLDAFRVVVDANPAAHLLLVGAGPLESEIRAQIERLNLGSRVHLAGFRKDVPRILSALDVFVFPSIVEGFGKALLEAQAAGVPVVYSRIPTSAEAVAPIFARFGSTPEDVPGLARNMLAALDARARETGLPQQAREFARKFTLQASVDSILAAWHYPGFVAPVDPFAPAAAPVAAAH